MPTRTDILVIDDDRDFADAMVEMLGLSDLRVAQAYDSASALKAAGRLKPIVALVDINLGAADGVELVPLLKERHPDLICVMITGRDDVNSAVNAVRRGAYDFLRKPIGRDEILVALDRCFERHRLETEKRAAERRLRDSEQRFRAVFDNSPSSITLTDNEGRYRLVNAKFEEWTGVPRQFAIGRTPSELFPARQSDSWERPDSEVVSENKLVEYEWRIADADDQGLNLSVTKFPVFDTDGAALGTGTIATDISALRQAQSQLAAVQKAEAVGRLTGGMAHEFNNLLQAMTSHLELIAMGLQREKNRLENPDMLDRSLTGAMRACETAGDITKSLLAYGRKQPLQPRPLDLSEMVVEMGDVLRGALGETVQYHTVIGGNLWPTMADRGQMQSALINLALNARDAMPRGGGLTIELANVTVQPDDSGEDRPPGDFVRLSVTDTGHGISDDDIDKVFEPFYTTKEVGKGTGLGLSMVYGFVTQSGGFVDISSHMNKGTRIDMYLPRHRDGGNGADGEARLRGAG